PTINVMAASSASALQIVRAVVAARPIRRDAEPTSVGAGCVEMGDDATFSSQTAFTIMDFILALNSTSDSVPQLWYKSGCVQGKWRNALCTLVNRWFDVGSTVEVDGSLGFPSAVFGASCATAYGDCISCRQA